MKTCLLCNTDAPDDAATCPNDGEASWSEPVADAPSADDAPKRSRAPKATK